MELISGNIIYTNLPKSSIIKLEKIVFFGSIDKKLKKLWKLV
jgi:hypothetical protein